MKINAEKYETIRTTIKEAQNCLLGKKFIYNLFIERIRLSDPEEDRYHMSRNLVEKIQRKLKPIIFYLLPQIIEEMEKEKADLEQAIKKELQEN